MKNLMSGRRLGLTLALVVAGVSAALVASPAATAAKTETESPGTVVQTEVGEVTVYADRARVTRQGKVTLGRDSATYVVRSLPGWIDPESVRVVLEPANAGEILDVRVDKEFLVAATSPKVMAATSRVVEVQDQLAAISDEEAVLRAEIQQLESLRAFSLDKVPRDMVVRDVKIKTVAATLAYVSEGLRKSRKGLRELGRQRRDLQPEMNARQQALRELQAQARLEERHVSIEILGKRAGARATLKIVYLTPGASWEPTGELRVNGDGAQVKLSQVAQVMQSTGEDWSKALLTFSTQRPSDTLSVPEVTSLLVGASNGGLSVAVQRASQSFEQAQSTYASQSAIANISNRNWSAISAKQDEMKGRALASFALLAERGTTAHFKAIAKHTVRNDGKAVRVPLGAVALDSTVKLVAVPEVSRNVVRTAELVNGGELPLLPGRMGLFVDGAFVGNSQLPFVAPGEHFSTFLGVHDRVKIERVIDRKRSSIERGRKRTIIKASFIITADNLGAEPVKLHLSDRVPVVQNDDIELDDVIIPKKARRSRDGVVTWQPTIKGGAKARWRIEYVMEYPNTFLETQRAAPASKRRKSYDFVDSLEKSL